MDSQTNKKITWSLLELTGLLEEEDAHVRFERTIKHLALHPYHLINIKRGLNQILKSSLNCYDKELNGFMLAFKNPKLLNNFGELLYDSSFIHVDIEADFYLFRPVIGSFLKGIVNKKGLDHIVVLVHKIYTISIPKPDNIEEWLGDSVEIGQEIRCCVNQVDNKSKPPFICASLNSDYLQGCRLSESINNVYNMEDVIKNHNLDSTIKLEKTSEISEDDTISVKEKKHRKKQQKSCEIDTFKNIKYEEKEKRKYRKKHKKSSESDLESTFEDTNKTKLNNKAESDIYINIKCEDNIHNNSIENHNLNNSTIKIDNSINRILEDDAFSDKEKEKFRKKHKKYRAIDPESTSENKSETILNNNTDSNIHKNIKCEDNVHNTNSAVENNNLSRVIKIEKLTNEISEDATLNKEKIKHRKKRKKSPEIDTENEVVSDHLESYKKRKKTSIFSDSESKTYIKIKAEKFDSDVESKFPVKIKIEKV